MLITLGKISKGDYGEESLISRFLLSLILNEYSVVNMPDGQAFRDFGKRCLGLGEELSPEDMRRATATVEFQPSRCSVVGDRTKFDVLFTLESELKPDWVWGIEAKYFDRLRENQIEREVEAVRRLAKSLKYKKAGILFIAPEQQLESIVGRRYAVKRCLSEFLKAEDVAVRLTSWEIIFEILIHAGLPKLREELTDFCELRNKNQDYPEKLLTTAKVGDWSEWEKRIITPPSLKKPPSGLNIFGKHKVLAEKIIEMSGLNLQERSKHTNLRKKRVKAQLHPNPDGVDLAIPEADENLPGCQILKEIPIQSLHDYSGPEKDWLEGNGKIFTNRPAAAFHIPGEIENDAEHPAWKEVEDLLEYARTR